MTEPAPPNDVMAEEMDRLEWSERCMVNMEMRITKQSIRVLKAQHAGRDPDSEKLVLEQLGRASECISRYRQTMLAVVEKKRARKLDR